MMTFEQIAEIINQCTYKKWSYILHDDVNEGLWLQLKWIERDCKNNIETEQKSRKWKLSYHMCENELVRTYYKAVKCALEHELDEQFMFKNMPVFNPHINYSDIVKCISEGHLAEDMRS